MTMMMLVLLPLTMAIVIIIIMNTWCYIINLIENDSVSTTAKARQLQRCVLQNIRCMDALTLHWGFGWRRICLGICSVIEVHSHCSMKIAFAGFVVVHSQLALPLTRGALLPIPPSSALLGCISKRRRRRGISCL